MLELVATDWGRILSWQSPVGLAIFFAGAGLFIWLLSRAGKGKKEEE